MIRQSLTNAAGTEGEPDFRWRGREVTRLEGFSDAVFALFYWHAWTRREALFLTPVECLKTRHSFFQDVAMAVIGLMSASLAMKLPKDLLGLAGWLYAVTIPYFSLTKWLFKKQLHSLGAHSVEMKDVESV